MRKFLLRYLCLRRFHPHIRVSQQPDANGRYHRTTWAAQPWYVKPTVGNRWRWQAWKECFTGRPLPGYVEANPEGYRHDEVGPARFQGKDLKEFVVEKERLMKIGRRECPL